MKFFKQINSLESLGFIENDSQLLDIAIQFILTIDNMIRNNL